MIVLTGGAGFIGSCFLKKLNDKGISDILVVDRLSDSTKWKNLIGKEFDDYIHKTLFRENLNKGYYGNKIEAIIHFGACSATTEPDVDYLFDNNLSYSKELATYAVERNLPFIYASSAATYGDGALGYTDSVFDDLKPLNAYGMSKHLFDLWAIRKGIIDKIIGIKFFNVFGPNEYHKLGMTSMVYKSFHQVRETAKVKLFRSYKEDYKDGEQKRDFVYIKDAVEVIWNMYEKYTDKGIFNLGTGKSRSWNDLAESVFMAMKKDIHIEYVNMPDNLINQYQYFTEADTNKLMSSDYAHKFLTLEESIDDYVNNHLALEFPYF